MSIRTPPAPLEDRRAGGATRRRGRSWRHPMGGQVHRVDDLCVTGAAADVARQGLANLDIRRPRHPRKQVVRGHDQARRAEAALDRASLEEGLLNRMQDVADGESLDSRHLTSLRLAAE